MKYKVRIYIKIVHKHTLSFLPLMAGKKNQVKEDMEEEEEEEEGVGIEKKETAATIFLGKEKKNTQNFF